MERYCPSPKKPRVFYIYILFRLNGIPCYIGKGKGNRWLVHESKHEYKCSNIHLRNIIKQAKKVGKGLPKIKLRENLTEDEALALEVIFIKAIGREKDGGPLVNATDGGDGVSGLVYTPKMREVVRQTRLGTTRRPESNLKTSITMKGVPKSPEHAANAGAAQRGKPKRFGWWSTEEGRAKQRVNNPGHTGHNHSDAARDLIKAARARQTERDRARRANVSPVPPL